jgi:hypothetical protein
VLFLSKVLPFNAHSLNYFPLLPPPPPLSRHVGGRYCDGTSFAGALEGTHERLHYRGRANLDAVLDSLFARGMDAATDVVFTGGSAGKPLHLCIICCPPSTMTRMQLEANAGVRWW